MRRTIRCRTHGQRWHRYPIAVSTPTLASSTARSTLRRGEWGGVITQPDLFIYDPAADAWSLGAPVIESTSGHVVQVVGGLLYAIGGELVRLDRVLDITQVYNPAKDRWTLGAPLPIALHATANTVVDGSIYLFGGISVVEANSLGLDTVFRFDPPVPKNPPPTNLAVKLFASGDVRLKWKFKHRTSDATSVQVEIKSSRAQRKLVTLAPSKKKLRLSDLATGSTHSFWVRSRGPSGRSGWSDAVAVTIPN